MCSEGSGKQKGTQEWALVEVAECVKVVAKSAGEGWD